MMISMLPVSFLFLPGSDNSCGFQFNILLITVTLLFITSFSLFKSKAKLKKMNKLLRENADFITDRNEEIITQFEIIKKKNKELSKYRDHLEKMDKKMMMKLEIAREKAKESDKLKQNIISNVYHEIRTPVNAIIGFVQLLSIEEKINNTRYIQIIEKNADDLLLLVDNMIELSKIQSEKSNPEVSEIKLLEFIHKIYSDTLALRNAANKTGVAIKLLTHSVGNDDIVLSDRLKLNKIVKQLIDNALKYTQMGSVTIEINKAGDIVYITIEDTGVGIEDSRIDTIFDSFKKIEENSNLNRGMGLGLSIAKKLAEQIEAEIEVNSVLNEGTRIMLIFSNLKLSLKNQGIIKSPYTFNSPN
ncbi:MAG: HAMP domain-containing sensor histidine kinase [Bacteroidales bacterium]